MITTFQALWVTAIAIFPGATYTFAVERYAGSFGAGASDRLVRFGAASAAFIALGSGPGYALYHRWVATGRLSRGDVPAWQVEVAVLLYVAVPAVAGTIAGWGRINDVALLKWMAGPAPEPRAWDYVWQRRRSTPALVRVHLKSGVWIAGLFAKTEGGAKAYASGYPERGDLFLVCSLKIDPDTGELELDEDGRTVPLDGEPGVLVRWDEIEYLDLLET
jgi:hypothetical protein